MTNNVVTLPVVTSLPIPPERVINGALEQDFDSVVIVGYLKDGSEYFASSASDGPEVLWLLERSKKKLLEVVDG